MRSRKGFNDITIIGTIVTIFILLSVILPFIREDFEGSSGVVNDAADVVDTLESQTATKTAIIWDILFNLYTIGFWTFGAVVWWVDLIILMPMRIILVATIARNIWIGGGG